MPPWTIFLQTLIHDFDTLLWLNPGAEPVEVYATADALVAPDFKASGLLDTAVVVITFDNGARAVAEASFSAAYGYDVRGEVFGSAGMVTAGDGARSSARLLHRRPALQHDTARGDVELLLDAYTGEFVEFAAAVREGRAAVRHRRRRPPRAGRRAGLHRVRAEPRARTAIGAGRVGGVMTAPFTLAVCAEMVFTDLPILERVRRIDELGFAGRDLGLDQARHRRARRAPAPPSPR